MRIPMMPDLTEESTGPEALLAEIARMSTRRPRGRKPSALLLAAAAGAAASVLLAVSAGVLCWAVPVEGHALTEVRVEETGPRAVQGAETRTGPLLLTDGAGGEGEPARPAEGWDDRFLLDVTVTEETSCQTIPAPVEEREDPGLLVGERQVIQEGADGLAERVDRVILRDGREESRQTVSETTVTEPVAQVVAVGTGTGPEAAAGRFRWPCQGRVTSPFGARHIFGTEGFHRGTDIAAPQGTAITAAAAGRVCFAGEKGSYGNLVQIDHGNGYVTRYAHCAAFLAQEGDWVEQGQEVALVGSTGRSTGPHCHFEIRWQGEPFDPESCLP